MYKGVLHNLLVSSHVKPSSSTVLFDDFLHMSSLSIEAVWETPVIDLAAFRFSKKQFN